MLAELQAGRVQLRLMKNNITCGVQHLDVISRNCDMIGLSQLYLHALHTSCSLQTGGTAAAAGPGGRKISASSDPGGGVRKFSSSSSMESEDGSSSSRSLLDRSIIQFFESNDIPVQAFEKVFGIYEEFVERKYNCGPGTEIGEKKGTLFHPCAP